MSLFSDQQMKILLVILISTTSIQLLTSARGLAQEPNQFEDADSIPTQPNLQNPEAPEASEPEAAIAPQSQWMLEPQSTSIGPVENLTDTASSVATTQMAEPETSPIFTTAAPLLGESEADLIAIDRMSNFGREQNQGIEVPPGNGETIAAIEVRFVDDGEIVEGHTRDFIITREFRLEPGDVYDPELAEDGLQRLENLAFIRNAAVTLEPTETPDEVTMVITVDEASRFGIGFGLTLPHPTALEGVTEPDTVLPGTNRKGGITGGVQFQRRNLGGNAQTLALGIEGGENVASFGISFTDPWIAGNPDRIGYSVNFFNVREVSTIFDGGDEIELANDNDPWVHRLGGGFEFFLPLGTDLAGAMGLSYQRVTVRDGAFSGDQFTEDEEGNDLTVSEDGRDDVLSYNFAAAWDRRDDRLYPSQGFRVLLRNDLYIPIGEADIAGSQAALNYTHFIPVPLFGFDDGPRTLVINVQGGTHVGDLPPYEAFSLGGSGSVRGYEGGEIGSARSFVQGSLEYRFPIFDFMAFREDIDVGGTLFVDYATDLGSGDTVIGEPAEVRDKPGDGLGFGFGLRLRTPIGPVRFEVGFTDRDDSEVMLQIGDRF